ncbi:sulfatase family protein [Nonomuraea diastatica]|uniref:Sulfatase n=1 Tax=Nonomuraea diastatica TaxID=1848329 RepID=A0A4R4WA03_9ACTN|nr:sulfatase [Nonomuraea diastatica]TDD15598.1 sulfatase [Nonomuraea diastatica]
MSLSANVRRILAVALTAILGLTMASQAGAGTVAKPQRPNIIFFLVDDMSADLLPYMDTVSGLARNGTTFTDYYVSNSLCCPSRASMFTGQFPHNTGVETNKGSDRGGYQAFEKHENRTYAVSLDQAGYRTGYLGKYINEYPVGAGYKVPAGWDEWHVAGGAGYNEFSYQLTRYIKEETADDKPLDPSGGKYLVDVLGQRAAQFIERSREHAPGEPFFLQVSPFSPHSRVGVKPGEKEPRFPPARRDRPRTQWPAGEFPNGDCGGTDCGTIDVSTLPAFNEDTADKPSWVRRDKIAPKLVKELRKDFRNRIRMVQSIDDMVERVLSTLTDEEKRTTYVVFTSDNGFHLGQHRLVRGKSTAYDHDVRVPLLVRRPAAARHGDLVTGAVAQNVDLFATFLDLAGADPAARDSRDGRSLLPLIQGRKVKDWRDAALIEHVKPDPQAPGTPDPDADSLKAGNSQPPTYAALRTAGDLYVEYEGEAKPEYYDTVADPHQETNDPGNARTADLGKALDALRTCGRPGAKDCWTAARLN